MKLSDYDLRQLDEEVISSLSSNAVKNLAINLLADLKSSREQLNQNSQNSSRPPSSQAPWDKISTHIDDDDEETDTGNSEPLTEDEALKTAVQIDTEAPFHLPPDNEFQGVALSEWRLVGPVFACLIVCLCKRMRLSRARIREFLQDWVGVTLSVGTINNTLHEAGRAAMPVEEMLVQEVLDSDLLNIDETSWNQKGDLFWLWAFVSSNVVLFKISKRTSYVFQELIIKRHYAGWIMTDGYQVYRQYQKRLSCWAHLIRNAQGLKEALNNEAQNFGEKTLKLMNELIKEARESPPDIPLPVHYQQHLDEYEKLCEKMLSSEHKKMRALVVEMLNDWETIFTVLKHLHLPLTNNEAECALCHWVILRKISFGRRTEVGARVFAILASVIETCRIRECSPWRYLANMIANRRTGLLVPPLPVKTVGV